ncbi:Telobox protein 1 [Neolecta irregularis DAH-3]|uniref:Telobox protein 1 n=1 Tax=Neolecta irregularis (strain DAH-3) TaxID=1198029 RepID=A0A1U7LL94_NEOID|nr:Telobox protein 1 [Neolecta irregularis DAH-3]|eukprot:OLL23363.1 Telobox protein 1 [Neolecta irregularis DAH-3]
MPRKKRTIWSREETMHMLAGCEKHGVGNWKKILDDPTSAVDLKDRHRSFIRNPKRLPLFGDTPTQRRRKRLFTAAEDDRLLKAFDLYGPAWAKIQRDASFSLSHRKSTDLRDHFRHAFPEKYTAAGLKQHDTTNTPSSIRKITPASDPLLQHDSPRTERPQLPSLDSLINTAEMSTSWPF